MTAGRTRREALATGSALLAMPGVAAGAARKTGPVGTFVLPCAVDAPAVPPEVMTVRTDGYRVAGDGGGALYRRATVELAGNGRFSSADGAWWALVADAPSVRVFGAVGDGRTDDRLAIQAAIDWAAAQGGGTIILPVGRFRITLAAAPDGAGLAGLWLRSGVRLEGAERLRSVLVLADAQRGAGTYARVIGSSMLADAALVGFTLDGNRAGQGVERDATNGGAVLLGTGGAHPERVMVERMVVRGANGQGIQLVGHPTAPGRDLTIRGNRVEAASFIGIQVGHFSGLVIEDNDVVDCHDNGIDLYGDNFVTGSNTVTGRQASIRRNRVRRCASGVFLETVADIDVTENLFDACRVTGLHINRIHGEPSGLRIVGNRTQATPIGASITGDTGGVAFQGNHFSGFSQAGLQFGLDGQGNVSFVVATGNVFDCRAQTGPLVLGSVPHGVLAWIRVTDNIVYGLPPPERLFVNRYATNHGVHVGGFIGVQADLPQPTRE